MISRYKVYDEQDTFLGFIHGEDEEEALSEALAFDMATAYRVEIYRENIPLNFISMNGKKVYLN